MPGMLARRTARRKAAKRSMRLYSTLSFAVRSSSEIPSSGDGVEDAVLDEDAHYAHLGHGGKIFANWCLR